MKRAVATAPSGKAFDVVIRNTIVRTPEGVLLGDTKGLGRLGWTIEEAS